MISVAAKKKICLHFKTKMEYSDYDDDLKHEQTSTEDDLQICAWKAKPHWTCPQIWHGLGVAVIKAAPYLTNH